MQYKYVKSFLYYIILLEFYYINIKKCLLLNFQVKKRINGRSFYDWEDQVAAAANFTIAVWK